MDTMLSSTIPAEVRLQAASWLVELQSEQASDATRSAWQAWRAAHQDHERAWQKVAAFSARLDQLPPALAQATLAAPRSAARRRAVQALAVALFAGGAAWMLEEQAAWRQWSADRRTGTGQRTSLALADGTIVEMNASSAIDIDYSGSERVLRLIDGEILVTTAKDVAERPFYVHTGHGRLQALGTRFSVSRVDCRQTEVAVYEGAVEVRPLDAPPQCLQAGQKLYFSDAAVSLLDKADENATAWLQGMLVATDMPLERFVAALARYRHGRLAVDPAIAALKVTGTYPLADTGKVLDMLGKALPLQVNYMTRYWVTLTPRSARG